MNVNTEEGVRVRIVALATVALIAVFVGVASPADALGSFTVKLTAAGCTEGDYYGQSVRYGEGPVWYIRATTSYTNPICLPPGNVAGARGIGPSSASGWQYNNGSVVVYLNVGTTYPPSGGGQHNVNGAHLRNT